MSSQHGLAPITGWEANYERCIDIYTQYVLAKDIGCKKGFARRLSQGIDLLQAEFEEQFDIVPHPIDGSIYDDSFGLSGLQLATPAHLHEQPHPTDPTQNTIQLHEQDDHINLLYQGFFQNWFEFGSEQDGDQTIVDDVFMKGYNFEDLASDEMRPRITYVPLGSIIILGRGYDQ